MAEFCFECYKKYCEPNVKKENLVLDKNLDLCEGCGKFMRETVIGIKKPSIFGDITKRKNIYL